MPPTRAAAAPYREQGHDLVRAAFEERFLARELRSVLAAAAGGELLDLGCGDGLVSRLAGAILTRYVGVDLAPPERSALLAHDLRDGLGPVGARPFDVYLGTFGIASHLSPGHLRGLLAEIAAHARPGALVALEALGLYSLEWPRLWDTPPGPDRCIPYRLTSDVVVHPWAADELLQLFDQAGIQPLRAVDRTVQAGPKAPDGRYGPALPALRPALNSLLAGCAPEAVLPDMTAPLPPVPAGPAAIVHHELAQRRRGVARLPLPGRALAAAVWMLEPRTRSGFGHGLLAVGRVR